MPITCQRCACREKGTHLFSFCVTLMPPARPVSCHIDSKSDRARRWKGCKKGLQGVRNGLKTLCNGLKTLCNGLKTRAANEFYTVKAGCFGALSLLLPESRGALRFKVNVPPACLLSCSACLPSRSACLLSQLSLLAFPARPACLPASLLAFPAQSACLPRSACFPSNPSTPYCIQRLNISPCHGKNQRSD